MPILQWLDRDKTIKQTNRTPYRLLEADLKLSYGDQNSHNKFYPDFLVQLNDGRILVVKYNRSQFAGGDDAEEKELIGKVWAEKSGNLFCIVWKKNSDGKDVNQQLINYFNPCI